MSSEQLYLGKYKEDGRGLYIQTRDGRARPIDLRNGELVFSSSVPAVQIGESISDTLRDRSADPAVRISKRPKRVNPV